jgi:lipopolysaccharide/colanic/teichoic acid biosynthesis glycosyltransferase
MLLIAGLVAVDVAAIALAVSGAYRLSVRPELGWTHVAPLSLVLAVVAPVAVGFFALNRLYVPDELLEGPIEYARVLYSCTLMAFSLSVLGFWGKNLGETVQSRTLVAFVWAFSLFAVGAGRFLARRLVRALRRRGVLISRAIIVGIGKSGISLARHFRELRHSGVQVVGFVDDFLAPGTPVTNEWKVLGPPSALPRILEQTDATEVIVVPTAMAWESFQDLIRTVPGLNGHAIRLASGFRDILATNVKIHQFGFTPLLTVERVRITGFDAILKRMLDFGVALVLLALVLPFLAVVVAGLSLRGRRPFRRVQVMGRGGRAFNIFLVNQGESRDGQPSVWRFAFRHLPQLVNVLVGQMSIAGPRPIPVERTTDYERWLSNLRTVKPGLIAPWIAREMPRSLDEEMEANLFYIRNYTVWLDLEILARSVLRMLRGHPEPAIWDEYTPADVAGTDAAQNLPTPAHLARRMTRN